MVESFLSNHYTSKSSETYPESYIVVEGIKSSSTAGASELGFGTDYEKIIFAEIISKIARKYELHSFFNYPKNNLLGNTENVTKTLAEKKDDPDLLWNFCEFENENNIGTFFKSVEDFNPKYILIVTQNWRNPGVLLHYLYHTIFGRKWDHGNLIKMTTKPIEEYVKCSKKYQLLEKGLFDAPWFILDVYEVGRYVKKLVPKSKQSTDEIQKSIFERSPTYFRKWASHHNYVLLKKCDF